VLSCIAVRANDDNDDASASVRISLRNQPSEVTEAAQLLELPMFYDGYQPPHSHYINMNNYKERQNIQSKIMNAKQKALQYKLIKLQSQQDEEEDIVTGTTKQQKPQENKQQQQQQQQKRKQRNHSNTRGRSSTRTATDIPAGRIDRRGRYRRQVLEKDDNDEEENNGGGGGGGDDYDYYDVDYHNHGDATTNDGVYDYTNVDYGDYDENENENESNKENNPLSDKLNERKKKEGRGKRLEGRKTK
jgi:hypothetical protein